MSDSPKLPPGWGDGSEDDAENVSKRIQKAEPDRPAEEKRTPLTVNLTSKQLTPDTPIEVVLKCYLDVNARIRSVRTVNSYQNGVALFARHVGGTVLVSHLTDDNLASYFRHRETQVSHNTVTCEAATILAFVKWCARKRLCDDPDIRPPDRIKRRPQALTEAQLRDLFTAATNAPGRVRGAEAAAFWYALLSLLWQTGERIGAVLALSWDSIDFDQGYVTYPADTRKFGSQELIRPINDRAIQALKRLRESSPDQPFTVSLSAFYSYWYVLRDSACLPSWVTPHTIRKSVASHLPSLEDAREMLGHSNAAITARNYRDDRMGDERRLLDKLPQVDKPAKPSGFLRSLFGGGS